ncbi:hypothetical protein G9A89_015286 [Geosiphon pyriformis]|nr:hypothetical protein G9A89_015286 [Geosiphon pyriformis]
MSRRYDIWVGDYDGSTVDMLAGPFAQVLKVTFKYGENHSQADQQEKESRPKSIRMGKACDYLFMFQDRENGVGKNTGPKYKEH